MRGKAIVLQGDVIGQGITPAYARKSHFRVFGLQADADHPRICGEKSGSFSSVTACGGSPPRMRGKAQQDFVGTLEGGITPAYAGKSSCLAGTGTCRGDHPRVCGEKANLSRFHLTDIGSPPRMRGKAGEGTCATSGSGITPAYAGKRFGQS